MNTEQTIRDCAKRGLSRAATAQVLGVSMYKMRDFLSVLPDVEWPGRGQSIGNRRGNESRRGRPMAHFEHARQVRLDRLTHTVRGVTGTIPVLAKHFGVISCSVVRTRMSVEGMDLETALTMPPRPSARDGVHRGKPGNAAYAR